MGTDEHDSPLRSGAAGGGAEQPELPAWKAFVVQFSREASATSGVCAGRVEHLSSGRRARFTSRDELVAALTRLLAELGEPPTP